MSEEEILLGALDDVIYNSTGVVSVMLYNDTQRTGTPGRLVDRCSCARVQ